MKLFQTLIAGSPEQVVVDEDTLKYTIAQLLQNNGDTPMNIFVFTDTYHAAAMMSKTLYELLAEVSPIVYNKTMLSVQYLENRILFRDAPKRYGDLYPLMGIDAAFIFASLGSLSDEMVGCVYSRLQMHSTYDISGTVLETALGRKEV